MNVRLRGPGVPAPLLEAFATATDHAKLRPADVRYDQAAGTVTVPIRLAEVPARSWLRTLGIWRARGVTAQAMPSRLVVRNVTACKVDLAGSQPGPEEVELLFGMQIEGARLSAYSAEEDRGETCFGLEVEMSSLDVEVASEA